MINLIHVGCRLVSANTRAAAWIAAAKIKAIHNVFAYTKPPASVFQRAGRTAERHWVGAWVMGKLPFDKLVAATV